MDEKIKTIEDYLKSGIKHILQKKGSSTFSEIDFNVGKKRLRIASILLEKDYPINTIPHKVINEWGSLDDVPNCNDINNAIKTNNYYKDKKKVMTFVCKWNDKIINKPIDYLPRIPCEGDILANILWEDEELKNTHLPGNPKILYHVDKVFLASGYVIVDIKKIFDFKQKNEK